MVSPVDYCIFLKNCSLFFFNIIWLEPWQVARFMSNGHPDTFQNGALKTELWRERDVSVLKSKNIKFGCPFNFKACIRRVTPLNLQSGLDIPEVLGCIPWAWSLYRAAGVNRLIQSSNTSSSLQPRFSHTLSERSQGAGSLKVHMEIQEDGGYKRWLLCEGSHFTWYL